MIRRTRKTRREREGGFALLLVFVMAAVLAITLYMEIPRLAFEAQRQKEQMLVERGQQYQIAIRRYMQRGLRQGVNQVVGPPWPTKIEDLEDTNGRRFLRKRYLDPMTGKDEWRIIHINNGVLTDSINNKPKQGDQQDEGLRAGGIAEFAGIGQIGAGSSGPISAATRRRTSDGAGSGGGIGPSDPSLPGNAGNSGTAPGAPTDAGASGASGGSQPGAPSPLPGQPPPGAGPSGGGNWGAAGSPGPATPPTGQPSYPGQVGFPVNSNNPGGSPYPAGPGSNGNPPFFPQPGGAPGGPLSPQQLIGNILTQPRPGGMPQVTSTGNGTTIGGGMAGVASKLDADAIMVCGDHTNYAEWEFVFDPSKWRGPADPRKALVGTPVGGSQNSPSGSAGQGSNMPQSTQPGGGGPGGFSGGGQSPTGPGQSPGQGPGQGQGQPGGSQGNLGAICGMEARPGIP
jgi:type II secretory pathway pseudopilin PulG